MQKEQSGRKKLQTLNKKSKLLIVEHKGKSASAGAGAIIKN